MPWNPADFITRPAHEAWALSLTLTAALYLTLQAFGSSLSGLQLLGLSLPLVVVALVLQQAMRWHGYAYLRKLLVMLLLGHLGMLLGASMDFGSTSGLLMLAGWCSTLDNIGLARLWAKLNVAPWSYTGMLLGCNLGMLLTLCARNVPSARELPPWLFFPLSNLGMLLGLIMIDAWPLPFTGGAQVLALLMSAKMLAGMAAGMALVWWLARRLPGSMLTGHTHLSGSGA